MILRDIDHTSEYLPAVKALGSANSHTLGFFPEGAFDDHAQRKQVIVALDDDQTFLGYLLYRISHDRATIVHLCVEPNIRAHGIASQLFGYFRESVKDLRGIGLHCRRDYEASKLWPKLGFVAQYDKPGRGKNRTDLTFWWYDNGHPTLFTDAIAEQVKSKICAAIDANVFFDLYDPNRIGHVESSSLQADWLSDSLQLCVTDEILNDINRSPNEDERQRERELVKTFITLHCEQTRLLTVAEELKNIFSRKLTQRDESDRWHLARAIASNTQFFITRDQPLLDSAAQVYDKFGVTVLRPTDLIIHLDELRRESDYAPQRLAGTLSEIRLVQSGQEKTLTERFQAAALGEKRSNFTAHLRNILSDPKQSSCHVAISVDREPIALFAYDRGQPGTLQIPLLRVKHRSIAATLARFLIFRSIVLAGSEKRAVVTLADPYKTEIIESAMAEDGFFPTKSGPTKITLQLAATTSDLADRLAAMKLANSDAMKYCGQLGEALKNPTTRASVAAMSEIERLLWPLKITDAFIPTFLVPIRPEWAKELFDESLASQTLFGAKPELGLSREGVYYRSKNPQGALTAPARILWYVSYGQRLAGPGQVRACSRLDDVIIDTPKSLYRRFRRLGIYDWEHVFDLAKKNLTNEIMALRFSDTELFTHPIEWNELQGILKSFGCKTQLQSPVAIQPELFAELYHRATTN